MDNQWLVHMGFGAQRSEEIVHPTADDFGKAEWLLSQLTHYSPGRVMSSGTHARDRETVARAIAAERRLAERTE